MRILQDPWEGTHPAFPTTPEPIAANNRITVTFVKCLGVGLAIGVLRLVAPRRFPHAVGYGATGSLVVLGALNSAGMWAMDRQARKLPLVQMEKIEIPRRKLWKRSQATTIDDWHVLGALAGIGFAIRLRPLTMTIGRAFAVRAPAAALVGWLNAHAVFITANSDSLINAMQKHEADIAQGKRLYEERTNQLPPDWLYPRSSHIMHGGTLIQALPTAIPFTVEDEELSLSHYETADAMAAPNSHPHRAYFRDGKVNYDAIRDYGWAPEDKDQALRALENELDRLLEMRTLFVREAEFAYHECTSHERGLMFSEDDDSEPLRKQRKSAEFLSGAHRELWSVIAQIDWIIADNKKITRQVHDPDWLPPEPRTLDSETFKPKLLLDLIRRHKEHTQAVLEQAENMIPNLDDDNYQNFLRELKENDLATAEMKAKYEKRFNEDDSN